MPNQNFLANFISNRTPSALKPSFAMGRELGAISKLLGKAAIAWELTQQGRTGSLLDQALNAIPNTSDRDLGRMSYEALKKTGGQAMNETSYIANELLQGRLPYSSATASTPLQRAKVGDPMILGGKLGYKGADGQWHQRGEILEGDILNTLPTGPGFGAPPVPQISPEERAYNQERSRIAQLTSATPEEKSKLRGDLRDQGMRIWAEKYGNLAKKVKPGQSGYEVIQEVLNK